MITSRTITDKTKSLLRLKQGANNTTAIEWKLANVNCIQDWISSRNNPILDFKSFFLICNLNLMARNPFQVPTGK